MATGFSTVLASHLVCVAVDDKVWAEAGRFVEKLIFGNGNWLKKELGRLPEPYQNPSNQFPGSVSNSSIVDSDCTNETVNLCSSNRSLTPAPGSSPKANELSSSENHEDEDMLFFEQLKRRKDSKALKLDLEKDDARSVTEIGALKKGNEQRKLSPASTTGKARDDNRCKICNREFATKSYIEHHMRYVHGVGGKIKYFVCDMPGCDVQCKRRGDMTVHKSRHSKESPFACPICGKKFKIEKRLKDHKKRSRKCRKILETYQKK